MKRGIELLKEFNEKFRCESKEQPSLLKEDAYFLRHKLMEEENNEYLEACEKSDIEGIVDALGDELYILLGTIVAHGCQDIIEEVFVEIHRSNMSKLDKNGNPIINGEDGIYDPSRPMGKVLKGDGFTPPNIAGILDKYFSEMITKKLMDDELKNHLDQGVEAREIILRKIIEEKLSKADFKKFKKFEELADYFSGKVKILQERASFDETRFGVEVDGEVTWIKEKQGGEY